MLFPCWEKSIPISSNEDSISQKETALNKSNVLNAECAKCIILCQCYINIDHLNDFKLRKRHPATSQFGNLKYDKRYDQTLLGIHVRMTVPQIAVYIQYRPKPRFLWQLGLT